MRHLAHQDERRSGTTATSPQEPTGGHGPYCPASQDFTTKKVELDSLFPGGQTKQRRIQGDGSGNSNSPEPVNGYDSMKGIRVYRFIPRIGLPIDELNGN
jgi:hypothetical protein